MRKGRKQSIEERQKRSVSAKSSENVLRNIRMVSKSNRGRILSDETKQRMSISRKKLIAKGILFSEKTRKRMSESHKGKSPVNKGKISPIESPGFDVRAWLPLEVIH